MTKNGSCALVLALAMAASLPACGGKPSGPAPVPANAAGSVFFRIEDPPGAPKDGPARAWLATYTTGGRSARFRIELKLASTKGDIPVAFTDGAFLREKGSDTSAFLRDVAAALEARTPQGAPAAVDRLGFSAALLGQDLSRGKGPDAFAGAFTSKPKGNWIATKVFVADGAGEFFMNLDPVAGIGELSIKDAEYGNQVVAELAQVFGQGMRGLPAAVAAGQRRPTPRPTATPSLQQLVIMLKSPDPALRDKATVGLAEMGPEARDAIPALTEARNDAYPGIRAKAARALAQIGQVETGVAILAAVLADPGARSAYGNAAAYLGEIGPQAKSAVPALLEMLEREVEVSYRAQAIETLGKIGPGAAAAVPALKRALKDNEPFVRDAATTALKSIQGS